MKQEAEAFPGDRFAALAGRYDLTSEQTAQLRNFLETLAQDRHAPTAVRDPEEALDVHLADSLAGLPTFDEALAGGVAQRAADLGSGAGLPGLPLAVARPSVQFDLVEATQRKCSFLTAVVARLGLDNVAVRCTRAEELPEKVGRESYGLVLARALAPLATLVEYAGPLLAEGGVLIAWKGRRDPDEERGGEVAGSQVGLEPLSVEAVTPYEQSRNRHLNLYRKVRPCPPEFPRRPGMAHRHPLRES